MHDKESKTTAAAATVNAGAGSDPRSMPGLAHFCEVRRQYGKKGRATSAGGKMSLSLFSCWPLFCGMFDDSLCELIRCTC